MLIEHSFIGVGFVSSTQKPQALVLSFESGYKMLLDTSRMEVEVRRVDGTVRPWQRLMTASAVVKSDGKPISFSPPPGELGETLEISIDREGALAWDGSAPAQSDIDKSDRDSNLECEMCVTSTPGKLTLLLTVPSDPVREPYDALSALKRAYADRFVTVVSGSPGLYETSDNPHQSERFASQPRGTKLAIRRIERTGTLVTA